MLNTTIVPARELQKSYKSIIEGVKTNKRTVVLTTNNQPQAALVSLEDLIDNFYTKHGLKLAKDAIKSNKNSS